jgi:serine/threonine protein phosphatase 1
VTRQNEIFARFEGARRIWAVAAVHGDATRLRELHAQLLTKFETGDRLVYLGNFLGMGMDIAGTIDELLAARADVMCVPGTEPWDIAYLRGAQEEMWDKLLQIQFAPNPREVLEWMYGQGVSATLEAYGGDPEIGRRYARDGAVALTQWTMGLREAVRAHAGHDILMGELKRAAIATDTGLVLVNAGLDRTQELAEQRDAFWWGGDGFGGTDTPYRDFNMVVRGYDPAHRGVSVGNHVATIDGGCGWGGTLNAACLAPDGNILEWIEA